MSQYAPNQEDAGLDFYTQDVEPGPPMDEKEAAVIAAAYADSDGSHTEVDEVQQYGENDREAGFRAAQSAMKRATRDEEDGRAAARKAIALARHTSPQHASQEEDDPLSVYFGNVPLVKFGDLDTSGQELVRARAQYRPIDDSEDVNTFGFLCNDCAIDGMPTKKGIYPAPGQLLFPLPMMEADDAAKYVALIESVHGAGVNVPMEALVALDPPAGKKVAARAAYSANVAIGFNQIQRGQRTFVELYAPNANPMEEDRAPIVHRPVPPPAMSAPLRARVVLPVPAPVYRGRRLASYVERTPAGLVHRFEDEREMGIDMDPPTARERKLIAKMRAERAARKAMGKKLASKDHPQVISDEDT